MSSGFECTEPGVQHRKDFEYSWPNQLAESFNLPIVNLSHAGQSNNMIWANTQAELLNGDYDPETTLVVIGWTNWNRQEYVHDDFINFFNPWWQDSQSPRKHQPCVQSAFRAWVGRDPASVINDQARLLYSAQTWLQYHGYRYFWINAMENLQQPQADLILDTQNYTPCDAVWSSLQLDANYFQSTSQLTWLKEHWPKNKVRHPQIMFRQNQHTHWDQTALKAWAEHIKEKAQTQLGL